ncbi:hypothetical protein METBIDRAFT_13166 [Metschnikowia bicuspidata var. bicuspidata NRRL YB-4993]|uniref:Uncharacterized protein n=1 Tax=Metschnikowia bicuspidata var. bicuspidata NRRL YB-4993 TaxID=869754 RepID=A0A1A0H8E1_9ASCO|nr:hypothetical protein METBIDRAFT_13166 [Metschnikowia bicuspidata var. bicuspidata NRRL YB-4993]OBA20158.1 hypothetical protein METBIDRAFT_13166 [Metschnikowia bicuspidata var. bicuspidata NRRL YB-4993]
MDSMGPVVIASARGTPHEQHCAVGQTEPPWSGNSARTIPPVSMLIIGPPDFPATISTPGWRRWKSGCTSVGSPSSRGTHRNGIVGADDPAGTEIHSLWKRYAVILETSAGLGGMASLLWIWRGRAYGPWVMSRSPFQGMPACGLEGQIKLVGGILVCLTKEFVFPQARKSGSVWWKTWDYLV